MSTCTFKWAQGRPVAPSPDCRKRWLWWCVACVMFSYGLIIKLENFPDHNLHLQPEPYVIYLDNSHTLLSLRVFIYEMGIIIILSTRLFTWLNGGLFHRMHNTYIHAKCSINNGDFYSKYWNPYAVYHCIMFLKVLFICLLKLISWHKFHVYDIEQWHHSHSAATWGKIKLWDCIFVCVDKHLLVLYLTNYVTTCCLVLVVVALRVNTDLPAISKGQCFQVVFPIAGCLCCWPKCLRWMREEDTSSLWHLKLKILVCFYLSYKFQCL